MLEVILVTHHQGRHHRAPTVIGPFIEGMAFGYIKDVLDIEPDCHAEVVPLSDVRLAGFFEQEEAR